MHCLKFPMRVTLPGQGSLEHGTVRQRQRQRQKCKSSASIWACFWSFPYANVWVIPAVDSTGWATNATRPKIHMTSLQVQSREKIFANCFLTDSTQKRSYQIHMALYQMSKEQIKRRDRGMNAHIANWNQNPTSTWYLAGGIFLYLVWENLSQLWSCSEGKSKL